MISRRELIRNAAIAAAASVTAKQIQSGESISKAIIELPTYHIGDSRPHSMTGNQGDVCVVINGVDSISYINCGSTPNNTDWIAV